MKQLNEQEVLHRAAVYCSAAERCKQEVKKKIEALGLPPEASEKIIAYLQKERYLDENRYARSFASDKFRFSKWGRIKIGYELQKKGIALQIRTEALHSIDENDYERMLLDLLKSKKRTIRKGEERELWIKLFRFAASHGFESEVIKRNLKQLFNGSDYDEVME